MQYIFSTVSYRHTAERCHPPCTVEKSRYERKNGYCTFYITYFIFFINSTSNIYGNVVNTCNLYVSDKCLFQFFVFFKYNKMKRKETVPVNGHSHINVGILKINKMDLNAWEIFLLNSWRTFWLASVMVSNCPFFLKYPQQFWEGKKMLLI